MEQKLNEEYHDQLKQLYAKLTDDLKTKKKTRSKHVKYVPRYFIIT